MTSKVVYILGAGFSAPLGLPVMSDFLSRSKDLYFEDPERFKHFNKVFLEIHRMARAKNYLEIDLFNIEQILSILDMEDYASGTSHRDDFTKYLADTISTLTPTTSAKSPLPGNWDDWLFAEDDRVRAYCYWLAGLLGIWIRSTKWTGMFALEEIPDPGFDYGIITLNYDLVLENCLDLINNQVDNGELRFRGTVDGEGFPVAKLHGSIDLVNIVPPTWQKLAGPEVRDAWKLAVHLLTRANEVRVLGFSLPETDGYVKYLLSLGAMRAPHLKQIDVICLDPTGDVQERYDRLVSFPGFRYRSIDLQQYIGCYGDGRNECLRHPFQSYSAVQFTGIEEHHERMVAG